MEIYHGRLLLHPHNLHYVQHLWAFNKNCQMHGQSFVSTITHDE